MLIVISVFVFVPSTPHSDRQPGQGPRPTTWWTGPRPDGSPRERSTGIRYCEENGIQVVGPAWTLGLHPACFQNSWVYLVSIMVHHPETCLVHAETFAVVICSLAAYGPWLLKSIQRNNKKRVWYQTFPLTNLESENAPEHSNESWL